MLGPDEYNAMVEAHGYNPDMMQQGYGPEDTQGYDPRDMQQAYGPAGMQGYGAAGGTMPFMQHEVLPLEDDPHRNVFDD